MPSNLHALGLVPDPAADPDAKLFRLLDEQAARNDEWRRCKTEQDRGRVLRQWRDNYVPTDAMIAEVQPKTLLGLLAKADFALRSWREDTDPNRFMRIGASTAACLEQAVATLAALHDGPVLLRRHS